ncbi:hypothetical protein NB693_21240 [Pantoea ananatis]|uniref:hypothetical protein n=1 Tax=Pantoea ananas TaxID=553 RepID=UPI002220E88B|nr:hypothetical protein [Pantoea ananatis]
MLATISSTPMTLPPLDRAPSPAQPPGVPPKAAASSNRFRAAPYALLEYAQAGGYLFGAAITLREWRVQSVKCRTTSSQQVMVAASDAIHPPGFSGAIERVQDTALKQQARVIAERPLQGGRPSLDLTNMQNRLHRRRSRTPLERVMNFQLEIQHFRA